MHHNEALPHKLVKMDSLPLAGCDFLVTAFHFLPWTKQIIHFSLPITCMIGKVSRTSMDPWQQSWKGQRLSFFFFSDFSKENEHCPKNTVKTGWEQFFVNRKFIEKSCDRERNYIWIQPTVGGNILQNKQTKQKQNKKGRRDFGTVHISLWNFLRASCFQWCWNLAFQHILKKNTFSLWNFFFNVKPV